MILGSDAMKPLLPLSFAFALLGSSPALGQGALVSDAFGLFDPADAPARMAWSDHHQVISGLGVSEAGASPAGRPEALLVHFGDKSLTAGGSSAEHMALILDAAGNLVADRTAVQLGAADGIVTVPTQDGRATRAVDPLDTVGTFPAWAQTGTGGALRQSERLTYRVNAALNELAPGLVAAVAPLPGEANVSLPTAELTDLSGNVPPDGVSASLILSHANGQVTFVPAVLVGGELRAPFLTRDLSGSAEARLHMAYASSPVEAVEIAALEAAEPPRILAEHLPGLNASRILIGPFTTVDGFHLFDGSTVDIEVETAAGRRLSESTWLVDGLADVALPIRGAEYPLSVTVQSPLGTVTLSVDRALPRGSLPEDDR